MFNFQLVILLSFLCLFHQHFIFHLQIADLLHEELTLSCEFLRLTVELQTNVIYVANELEPDCLVIVDEHLMSIISFLIAIIFTRVLQVILSTDIIHLLKFIVPVIDERIQERLVEIFQNRDISFESRVFIIVVPKYFDLFLAELFRYPLKMWHVFVDLHYHLLVSPLLRLGYQVCTW